MQTNNSKNLTLALFFSGALSLIGCQNTTNMSKAFELDSLVQKETIMLGGDTAQQRLDLSLSYVFPKGEDSLRYYLNAQMFTPDLAHLQPKELASAYFKRIQSDIIGDFVPSAERGEGLSLDEGKWETTLGNKFAYDDEHVVSCSIVQYQFTGGAHGYASETFVSFDRKSGRPINESNIFVDDYKEKLSAVIVEALMRQNGVHTPEDLENEGFFNTSEILPNNNFMITSTGLRYCFNPYEIAPYSKGTIYIDLIWDAVSTIIRPGSIVEQYI